MPLLDDCSEQSAVTAQASYCLKHPQASSSFTRTKDKMCHLDLCALLIYISVYLQMHADPVLMNILSHSFCTKYFH